MKNTILKNVNLSHYEKIVNEYGKNRIPFFIIVDFLAEDIIIEELKNLANLKIYYDFEGRTNFEYFTASRERFELIKFPISYEEYLRVFKSVQKSEEEGYSYLVNLTFSTPIIINYSLKEIFNYSKTKFKVLCDDKFVCFSPERFVKIENDKIFSYPMKGTKKIISPEDASELRLDEKEKAEHVTIVDLIRNDLGIVSKKVETTKFMYIDILKTNEGLLAQTSSEIIGYLNCDWNEKLGDILFALLPAGSISGAPKKKTIEIILENETHTRGFYTGIAGLFDGQNFDSCVLIRFIEKISNQYFFKSGGGITIYSDPRKEYQELIDKIYAPIY